jgi:hypothetical protein
MAYELLKRAEENNERKYQAGLYPRRTSGME